MHDNVRPLTELADRLRQQPRRRSTLLVGIDGRGGSGKSTLARSLAALLPAASVVEFDDFYRPSRERLKGQPDNGEPGGNFDWGRVRDQVLAPLSDNQPANYQRYDWVADRLAEWHTIEPGGIVIVEGNYSTRRALRDFYDFTIWIEAPHETRLQRGLARGHDTLDRWLEEWLPEEQRYLDAENPQRSVNLTVDGAPEPAIDPTTSVKILDCR